MTKTAILVPGKIHDRVIERLKDRFELVVPERNDPAALDEADAARIRGVAVSGNFSSAWIARLPKLEVIANFGVGYDTVDVEAAAARGIVVTNTPDVLNDEVADVALGLLLNAVRELPKAEAYLRAGEWAAGKPYPLSRFSLKGRRVGLYGLGRIGLEIARRLEPFKVEIAYHTRRRHEGVSYTYYESLPALAEAVDVLIAIVPKTPETHKVIDAAVLSALGPEGILVNVGRGWSVDEDALAAALESGSLGAAGLDVFYDEPHVPARLLSAPNTVLLPHIASASVPTRNAMADLVADNIIAWFEEKRALTPVPETPVR